MIVKLTREKKLEGELDQSRVLRILFCAVLLCSETLRAIPIPHNTSGSVVGHDATKTTYFFSLAANRSPSYLVRAPGGAYLLAIKKAQDSYQFQIKNGLIVEATIEKRIRNYRAIASFGLKGQKYQLRRFTLTNRFSFSANADCPTDTLTISEANILDLGAVDEALVRPSEEAGEFIARSCKNLNVADAEKLVTLKKYFDAKEKSSTELTKCLSDLALVEKIVKIDAKITSNNPAETPTRLDSLKDSIGLVVKSIEGRSEKNRSGLSPLTIECKKNPDGLNKNPAKFDVASGRIVFYLKSESDSNGKDQLLNSTRLKHTFLHEFVHLSVSQPSKCSAVLEDEIAEDIAKVCAPDSVDFNKGGGILIDNPFGPDPSLADTKLVEERVAIQISGATNEIPIQRVDPASLDFIGELPANASATPAVGNSFQAAVASPMSRFAMAADQMAAAMIPRAEAQAKLPESKGLAIVEATVIPEISPAHANRFLMRTTVQKPPIGTLALSPDIAQRLPASEPQREMDSTSRGYQARVPASEVAASGVAASGERASMGLLGSSFGRQLKQSQINQKESVLQDFQVGGITFTNRTLSGTEYQKYLSKMRNKDQQFKAELEKNGILISRNGSVITRPKQVALLYIDTGQSLIYGNY